MLNLSYHSETLLQIFMKPELDFCEMFCHHLMSILTIGIAYITGYNNLAIPFMLIIDFADIFVGLMRIFVDIFKSDVLKLTMFSLLMVSLHAYTKPYSTSL